MTSVLLYWASQNWENKGHQWSHWTELPILRDGLPPSTSLCTTSLRKWQNFSCTGRSSCNIKRDSKPFFFFFGLVKWNNINLAVCSTEDVVLIKGAAVASNTSNPLDLVEAQGSHLREIIKCLPRRLALLEHLLSLGKVACFSHQEHRVSLQPIPSYLAGSTWQAFVTPRIWCWLWATQV